MYADSQLTADLEMLGDTSVAQSKKVWSLSEVKTELNGQPHVSLTKAGALPTVVQQACKTLATFTTHPENAWITVGISNEVQKSTHQRMWR